VADRAAYEVAGRANLVEEDRALALASRNRGLDHARDVDLALALLDLCRLGAHCCADPANLALLTADDGREGRHADGDGHD
jgi:hypothetical protein